MEPTIDCRDLFLRLGDDEVLVVDCREEADWERYRFQVPGALRMSPSEVKDSSSVLPDDELIVLCGVAEDGSDVRRAFRQLRFRGRNVVCLEGGLRAWVAFGFPTEKTEQHHVAMHRFEFAHP